VARRCLGAALIPQELSMGVICARPRDAYFSYFNCVQDNRMRALADKENLRKAKDNEISNVRSFAPTLGS
jgi:hypothetical protein